MDLSSVPTEDLRAELLSRRDPGLTTYGVAPNGDLGLRFCGRVFVDRGVVEEVIVMVSDEASLSESDRRHIGLSAELAAMEAVRQARLHKEAEATREP